MIVFALATPSPRATSESLQCGPEEESHAEAIAIRFEAAFDVLLLVVGGVISYVSWGYGFGSLSRPGGY